MLAIDAHGLTKSFVSGWFRRRRTEALRGVSLAIPRGAIFGLLGPNGAGKTTLLSILATLLLPDGGRATVLGHDLAREPGAIRERLNMASGNASFVWSLKVDEIVAFYGRLYGLAGRALRARVDELIALCELTEHRRVSYNELSTGLKQRLALAKSLVNQPELLFLDEPTLGLDPDISVRLRAEIAALRRTRGTTIVLTTHYMREAEELCDEIAFIKEGAILAQGTSDALKRQIRIGDVIALRVDSDNVASLGEQPGVLRAETHEGRIELTVDAADKRLPELLRLLHDQGRSSATCRSASRTWRTCSWSWPDEAPLPDELRRADDQCGGGALGEAQPQASRASVERGRASARSGAAPPHVDQVKAELVRTWAFALRNLLMASRNVFFVFELTFWPVVSVLSIGLMTRFLELSTADTAFVLVGTMALAVAQVCQLDVAYAVLFDVWSKSMKHQFLAPIAVRHLTVGSWLVGILRGLVVFALLAVVSRRAFGFDVFAGGALALGAFLLGCFLMALIVGVCVCALVMLFGTRAETSAWASVNLVLLLSGIYYPVSMLPAPIAAIATGIPLTYVLDAFRSHYGFAQHFDAAVVRGLVLAGVYVALAHWALGAAVRRTRRTGLLLKMSD